jgi:O-acetylserine/cysteine efflux transporter
VTPFALLIPVFGMASTAIVFGEQLTPMAAAGSALVFIGLAINVFGWRLLR